MFDLNYTHDSLNSDVMEETEETADVTYDEYTAPKTKK